MNHPEQGEENFAAFPSEVTARFEAQAAARAGTGVVHNPHHPDPAKRGPVPRTPAGPRPAAQGMQLANSSAGPRHASTSSQPPLVPQAAIDAHAARQVPQAMSAPGAYQEHNNSFDFQVQANSEHEAVSFALPSNFWYYDFRDTYIKPFRGRNYSKLNRAREEESMLHVVEAVSSVIHNVQYPTGLAFELTLPDFYACLYWLRLNSFLKHAFIHQTMCRSIVHHKQVEEGKLDKDTLRHAETITRASIKTKMLTAPLDAEKYSLDDESIYLVPATMRDVLDITMNEDIDRYDARIASSFQFKNRKADLSERMEYIDNMTSDDIATITQWEKDVNDYGVEESVQWKCKTCGHVHTDELELEAHSFFPSAA